MLNSKHKRQQHQHRPRLDRRNAVKNIDYDAGGSAFASSSSNSSDDDRSVYKTRSLDLLPLAGRTSFRIEGIEGEVDQIFRYLGLGPDDFSIPVAAWEARKSLSHSSNFRTARSGDRGDLSDGFDTRIRAIDGEVNDIADVDLGDIEVSVDEASENEVKNKLITHGGLGIIGIGPTKSAPQPLFTCPFITSGPGEFSDSNRARIKIGNGEENDGIELILDSDEVRASEVSDKEVRSEFGVNGGWGIRGSRPPQLAPPPVMMRSVVEDTSSTWDIFKAFGPQDAQHLQPINELEEYKKVGSEEEIKDDVETKRTDSLESCSDSSNDESSGDSVPLVGERHYTFSPSASFRRNIMSWQKGDFLGAGSFGTVYEGFTE